MLQHHLPQTGDAPGHVPVLPEIVHDFLCVLVWIRRIRRSKRPPDLEPGFDVRVEDAESGSTGVLRVPFLDGEVTERKKIKDAIVALSKKCAEINPAWRPHGSAEE